MSKGKGYKKPIIIIICVIVCIIGGAALYVYNILDKINHVPLVHESEDKEVSNKKPEQMTPEDL